MTIHLITFLETLASHYQETWPYLPPCDPMYDSMMPRLQGWDDPKPLDLEHAYDGSSRRRQRRALKPLERDILCRIISDILSAARGFGAGGIRLSDARELLILDSIYDAINPRPNGE